MMYLCIKKTYRENLNNLQEILWISGGYTKETFTDNNTDDEKERNVYNCKYPIDKPKDKICEAPGKRTYKFQQNNRIIAAKSANL